MIVRYKNSSLMTLAEAYDTPLFNFFFTVSSCNRNMDVGIDEEDVQVDMLFQSLLLQTEKFREIEEYVLDSLQHTDVTVG